MSDASARPAHSAAPRKRSLLSLYAVMLICAAPVVAAALVYFLDWRPAAATNYGDLVQPQRPVPPPAELQLTTLEGDPFDLRSLAGRWLLVSVDSGACGDECAKKLFIMRQTHASTGKEIHRIERVWLIADDEPVPTIVIRAYEGMHFLRARRDQLERFLALPPGEDGLDGLARHIWLIDPRNNQMMRFPENPDPLQLRKDIGKLLQASRIG
ncbi:membrane protein [Pigmentiphaga soli]|uniref:Membrane protein n=1 Tax=Pigmentiphaga soli TaxID=1007095 RepID=A0ABP8GIK2_9BURK